MARIDLAWRLRSQAGVISRDQCHECGLTDDVVQTKVRRGEWGRLERGLYVAFAERRGYESLLYAATLSIGGQVALTGASALWWADRTSSPKVVEVAVPRGRNVQARRGIVIHHNLGTDRLSRLDPPTVPIEDAVLLVAAQAATTLEVEGVITAAVRKQPTTVDRLLATLVQHKRHPRRRLLQAMLTDVADGAESPLELKDLRNDRKHGLPGERQVKHMVGGRGRRLDVLITAPGLVRPVVKELDGRLGHEDSSGRFRDSDRDNDAALRARIPLRFGWHALEDLACRTAAMTGAVLIGEGWSGRPRACGPTCTLPRELPRLLALRGT